MNQLRKIRIKPLCLALVLALLPVAATGCTGGAAQRIRLSADGAYAPQSAGDAFHLVCEAGLEKMASTDDLSLYWDKKNAGIAVKDTDGKLLCASLGAFADNLGLSVVSSLTVRGEDGRLYLLNTQENCAAFGAFKAAKTASGFSVAYSLALNKEEALCSFDALPEGALRVDMTLLFTLDGAAMCVESDCALTTVSEGYTVLSVSILPGLSADIPTDGGFILLPDGCGALANVSKAAPQDVSHTYYYGGPDPVAGETGGTALLPAFAFGNKAMSVCVTAEKGEALCSIAYRLKARQSGGMVYPVFTLTACHESGGSAYLGVPYTGVIKLRYIFLDAGRGYADIATVCRERLVRDSKITSGTLSPPDNIPFLLTAVGAVSSKSKTSFTQFFEAREMLSILKAKGVDNLALRYVGTLSGGLTQSEITDAGLLRFLGGKGEKETLTDYARVQNLKVFFELNLLSSNKSNALKTLSGKTALFKPFSEAYSPFLKETDKLYASSVKRLDAHTEAALRLLSGENVSLGDVCGVLYGDPKAGYTRQDAMEAVTRACRAFAAQGDIMLSGPALYLMESVAYVDGMPMDTVTAHEDNITAVPFLQIVLHGTLLYAGTPLNFYGDSEFAVLRCVEYGCLPSAVLTYRTAGATYDTYYATQSQYLAAAYEEMDGKLSDLYGQRITGHTKIKTGVYCTEYANTTLVYVNYTDKSVEVSGLTLAPMDYMRVN